MDADDILHTPIGRLLCEELASSARGNERLYLDQLSDSDLYRLISKSALEITSVLNGQLLPETWVERAEIEAAAEFMAKRFASSSVLSAQQPTPLQSRTVLQAKDSPLTATLPILNPLTDKPVALLVGSEKVPVFSSKPQGGLWTSSILPDGSSAWSVVVDSGLLGDASGWSRNEWHLDFEMRSRSIYSINSALDWHELCHAFPVTNEGGTSLDWEQAADVYDGIHLSIAGLLLGQAVLTGDGAQRTCLWGWDAESTVWLNLPERDTPATLRTGT